MTRLLLIVCLCLLASSGWAAEPPPRVTEPPVTPESLWYTHEETCLAKMEAAMRAMKPFIISGFWPNDPNAYAHTKDGITAKYDALTQWLDVKRECWRTP